MIGSEVRRFYHQNKALSFLMWALSVITMLSIRAHEGSLSLFTGCAIIAVSGGLASILQALILERVSGSEIYRNAQYYVSAGFYIAMIILAFAYIIGGNL